MKSYAIEVVPNATSMVALKWLDGINVEYSKGLEYYTIINNIGKNPKYEWKNGIF
jgi:hypothetical protein